MSSLKAAEIVEQLPLCLSLTLSSACELQEVAEIMNNAFPDLDIKPFKPVPAKRLCSNAKARLLQGCQMMHACIAAVFLAAIFLTIAARQPAAVQAAKELGLVLTPPAVFIPAMARCVTSCSTAPACAWQTPAKPCPWLRSCKAQPELACSRALMLVHGRRCMLALGYVQPKTKTPNGTA